MNTELEKSADIFLKYMDQKGGQIDMDDVGKLVREDLIKITIYSQVTRFLEEEGLIEIYGDRKHLFRLKRPGMQAAKSGIREFLDLEDQKKSQIANNYSNSIINHGQVQGSMHMGDYIHDNNINISIVLSALEQELNATQINELKDIINSNDAPEKKKSKLLEKLSSYGIDVLAKILTNVITKPEFTTKAGKWFSAISQRFLES